MVKLEDVLEGVEFVSAGQLKEHSAYLCKETGQVHWVGEGMDESVPEDLENEEKFIPLPNKHELGLGKPLALGFAREVIPGSYTRVNDIFGNAGAYPRFKDLLERENKLEAWYEYEEKETKAAIRQWCLKNGVKVDV